jgi:hypothetical protein
MWLQKVSQAERMLDATFSLRHALTDDIKRHQAAPHKAAHVAQASKAAPKHIASAAQVHHAMHRQMIHGPVHKVKAPAAPKAAAPKIAAVHNEPKSLSDEFSAYHQAYESTTKALYAAVGKHEPSKH